MRKTTQRDGLTRTPPAGAPIAHILRAQISTDDGQAIGASAFVVANRFKQIGSPSFFIVGRDVSTAEGVGLVQVSLFADEHRFRDYFYDPIHLAIDRAGEERRRNAPPGQAPAGPGRRWESFDILGPYSPDAAQRLLAVYTERNARFARHDDRPTEQPVPDRPEDQSWGFGKRLFWTVERPDAGDPLSRSAAQALDHLVASGLCAVLIDGTEVRKNPADAKRRSTILSFAEPESLSAALALPAMASAAHDGAFAPERFHSFFAIDPDDSVLALQLGDLLRRGLSPGG
jgi:hypothetical protein